MGAHSSTSTLFWKPPFSLLVLRAYSSTSGPAPALGTPGLCSQSCQAGPCSPEGQQPPYEVGPGSQLDWGPALPASMTTLVRPATTEGPIQPTEGPPLEHIVLVTRVEYTAESHSISPHKASSLTSGNINDLSNT